MRFNQKDTKFVGIQLFGTTQYYAINGSNCTTMDHKGKWIRPKIH